LAGSANINIEEKALIGIAVTSHSSFALATALVDDVFLTENGLQGEYFNDEEFQDLKLTRIDPNINFWWGLDSPDPLIHPDHFSIRWTGQIEPKATGYYTFIYDADDSAELWVDGEKQPHYPYKKDTGRKLPNILLATGRRYDLKMEYREGIGPASVRLGWAHANTREPLPNQALFCTKAVVGSGDRETNAPPNNRSLFASKGLLLRTGSFIVGSIKSVSENAVKFSYRGEKEISVAPPNIARIFLRVPPRMPGPDSTVGRTGVMLANGDFFEGAIRALRGGDIQLSSVLFGLKRLWLGELAMIAFNNAPAVAPPWEVRLLDGSMIRTSSIVVEGEDLILDEPLLGKFRVSQSALMEIRNKERLISDSHLSP
jgi:hypothetical protein